MTKKTKSLAQNEAIDPLDSVILGRVGLIMDSIQRLFQQLGLRYLDRSRVIDDRITAYDWNSSPYYRANRDEFITLTKQYGPRILAHDRAATEIRMVDAQVGWGVWSCENLEPGDFIGEYSGVIQESIDAPPDELVNGHYLSDYSWNYPDELPDGTEFEICALREGNELRFVNHSFTPNLAVDHTLVENLFVTFFRALRPIAPGEQLTIDYGEEYWSGGFRSRTEL